MTTKEWVQTASGRAFDLLTPRAEDVVVTDISRGLARLSRFSGATNGMEGYSVAQHSVLVADILAAWGAPPFIVREGLLHDAPEAYYGDITSPVQRAIRRLFMRELESLGYAEDRGATDPVRVLKSIVDPIVRAALDLPLDETPLVKRADLVALAIERRDLMAPCERDWCLTEFADVRHSIACPTDPITSERRFLDRLAVLDKQLASAA